MLTSNRGSGVRAGGNVPHTISRRTCFKSKWYVPDKGMALPAEVVVTRSLDATLLTTSGVVAQSSGEAARPRFGSHLYLPRRYETLCAL